jgi:hypothetical protein
MPLPPSQASTTPTPDPVHSSLNRTFNRRTAWTPARIKQFQANKKRANLLRKGVQQHLQKVEQRLQGKQRRSTHLYIKRCNLARGPNEKPFCSCILFGEDDYFLDRAEKTDGPSEGFRIVVHDGEDEDNTSEDSDMTEEDDSDDSDTDDDDDSEILSILEHAEADY